jgi:glutamyl-tRNA synthetase
MTIPSSKICVRFAPSPTGLLHVGNAKTALLNWLFARKHGGRFLLRIDDTDAARSTQEFENGIYRDLEWLGLTWDATDRQANRLAKYSAAFYRLQASGHIYPAYETEDELNRQRSLLAARKLPPVYNRASLDPANKAKWEAEGRTPHWRFRLSRSKIAWTDLIRGPVEIDTATMSDPVLVRADGAFLYTLPSVADDIDMAITHIIRGEDHVTNTAAQIEIFRALNANKEGATEPLFAHHPLLVGAGGEALSKRLGSLSLQQLREDGLEPMAVASYLAKIGTSDAVEPRATLGELAAECDFAHIGRAPAHFVPEELDVLNARTLHILPYAAVRDRLPFFNKVEGHDEAIWNVLRPNLARLSDAAEMLKLVTGPVTPVLEGDLAAKAAPLLPPEPWDEATWSAWTAAISAATGARGRALFHPLRLALTGLEHGPELKKLLPLIGRARTLARLIGETA